MGRTTWSEGDLTTSFGVKYVGYKKNRRTYHIDIEEFYVGDIENVLNTERFTTWIEIIGN